MDYKQITKDGITYHLIKTSRFKEITVSMFLTKSFDYDDLAYSMLLTNALMYSSKKYNTKNKIASYGEDLYGARVSANYSVTGASSSYAFVLDFINPKYTDNKYMDKTLDFFKEIILNPNTNSNHFNDEHFNIIKKDVIKSIESIKDNPSKYGSIKYNKHMFKGTPGEYSTIPNVEDVEKLNSSDLYKYYKDLFTGKYRVDIFILGEIDESMVNSIHSRFLGIKSNNKKLNLTIKSKLNKKPLTYEEVLNYNQSKLYLGYKFDNLNFHELNHVLRVYNTILGTMNDSVLFNVVRESSSLCYTIGSYVSYYNPSLTIYAGINKKNYEETVKLIEKCVNNMSDKGQVERLFSSSLKTINTYLNNYYDDSVSQINNYYIKIFENKESIEELRNSINKVTIDEVLDLNKKIHLDTIFFLKGDNNE